MTKTAEMLINDDIKKVYLGNLNTVEFDLKLPLRGENGSKITWVSDNELFLRTDGSVTRPYNGIGDRKIQLSANFELDGVVKKKTYEVHILEQPCKVKFVEVLPQKRRITRAVKAYLPGAAVLRADNGHYFSRQVTWDGGNEQKFDTCGLYILNGKVKDEEQTAKLVLEVCDVLEQEKTDTKPIVCAMDKGETVLLEASFCYDSMQRAIEYLKSIDDDQMLYNFRKAADMDTRGALEMDGWDSQECLLRGHTTGHYLSALALCYRETEDKKILNKLREIVAGLADCQREFSKKPGFHEGYIGGYSEEQFDLLEKGERYPNIWAPYYTLHKILAGLLDAYCFAADKEALHVAEQAGMWVYNRLKRLTKSECERMWDTYIAGEFGGINESLAKLYQLTAETKCLHAAKMFENDRLYIPMKEKYDTLEGMHANQHIPQIVGCMELFRATGEKKYYEIAEFFWETVTGHHIFANGGVGENEMFFEPAGTARHLTRETSEYCASYNMLKLTKELYQYNPKVSYMDYYERTMLNHIAAGGDKEPNGDISYFYPLAPGSVKDAKFPNSCCHGTGMESQMKYTEAIYFHMQDTLYVNLFLNSRTYWKEKKLRITQHVKQDSSVVQLNITGIEDCLVKIRCPYWCDGKYTVIVNNRNTIAKCDSDRYINIQKTEESTKVEIHFLSSLRIETVADNQKIAVLGYGPYILAALSESESYLEFSITGKDLQKEMSLRRINGKSVAFQSERQQSLTWLPLAEVDRQRHHVYWKMK